MNNVLIHNARVYNSALRDFYYGSVLVMNGKIAILHRGNVTEAPWWMSIPTAAQAVTSIPPIAP